jgi:hypothetical protein
MAAAADARRGPPQAQAVGVGHGGECSLVRAEVEEAGHERHVDALGVQALEDRGPPGSRLGFREERRDDEAPVGQLVGGRARGHRLDDRRDDARLGAGVASDNAERSSIVTIANRESTRCAACRMFCSWLPAAA